MLGICLTPREARVQIPPSASFYHIKLLRRSLMHTVDQSFHMVGSGWQLFQKFLSLFFTIDHHFFYEFLTAIQLCIEVQFAKHLYKSHINGLIFRSLKISFFYPFIDFFYKI